MYAEVYASLDAKGESQVLALSPGLLSVAVLIACVAGVLLYKPWRQSPTSG